MKLVKLKSLKEAGYTDKDSIYKFKVGNIHETSYRGDSSMKVYFKIIKRTDKAVVIQDAEDKESALHGKPARRKIIMYGNVETCSPTSSLIIMADSVYKGEVWVEREDKKPDYVPKAPKIDSKFDKAFMAFLANIQAVEDKSTFPRIVGYDKGKKYLRVWKGEKNNTSKSAYCFVDKEGNILKANGWKAPAKNFSRGNIFDKNLKAPTHGY